MEIHYRNQWAWHRCDLVFPTVFIFQIRGFKNIRFILPKQLMSELYYNTLTDKYLDMYVSTMNDHLKNNSYKENDLLDLHQKANSDILELVR